MRTTTKTVKHEVDGEERTFQIRKMDALHGSYLLKFCTEKFLPFVNDISTIMGDGEVPENEEEAKKASLVKTDQIIQLIPKALSALSEEELISFETRCLQTVDMMLPAGWQPVMTGNVFGVEELEDDTMTVLALCYEVVEFNLGSFFGGKGLGSLLRGEST